MIAVRLRKALAKFGLDVDVAFPERGITALFGRSGSGKSSIVRAISGAVRPDEGHIAIGGRVYFDSARGIDMPVHERRIGYVFQESCLFPHLSVRRNLQYGLARARQRDLRIDLGGVVDLLGIGHLLDRRTHHLSGGERQRVAIGRALLAQPEVLLMDEPLSSLDPPRKAELLDYIEDLRDGFDTPIIYISHEFNEVARLAEHLVVLDQGQVVRAGPLIELASDPALSPLVGRFEAGAVIDCKVLDHDVEAGLSTLAFAGGRLRVPRVARAAGEGLRVRVRARDVALSLSCPADISISNRLPGRLLRLTPLDGPYVDATVDVGGGAMLRALITRESVARLGLIPGANVWALVKTVAFDSRSLGFTRRARPSCDEEPG
jgi:molybdate transport system ATP-binding protein